LNTERCLALLQGLGIGVGHHEIDATEFGADHRVYGIAAAAPDPDDFDSGAIQTGLFDNLKHNLSSLKVAP
jgi:hypothetical protein